MDLHSRKLTKLALITGASSGIGFEFSFLVSNSFNGDIGIVARRGERLSNLKAELTKRFPSKTIICFKYDLSDQNQRNDMWNEINKLGYQVNLLINNAGFGSFGLFKDLDLEKELNMIDLNIKAIVDLCHKALPGMIANNEGQIVNVSSMASFQGLPFIATYAASKAFVTSFSLALGQEVQRYGIVVQALCPGPVPTEFAKVAGFPSQISFTNALSPQHVAQKSLSGLKECQSLVIPGIMNWLLAQANRFVPRQFAAKLAYLVLRPKYDDSRNIRGDQ